MYLKEIGRVPLLTGAQEVDLAMRFEAGGLAGHLLASLALSFALMSTVGTARRVRA